MPIRHLTSPADLALYDQWIKAHPQGSLWQSLEWRKYQKALGRETRIYSEWDNDELKATAMVVIDRTSFGLSVWDISRGPVGAMPNGEWRIAVRGPEALRPEWENLMEKIVKDAKKDKCLNLYYSPFETSDARLQMSVRSSQRHEQPEATRILNLTLPDEDLLAQMHQKGRYNIKVAQKNGVRVEHSQDIEAYAELAKQTAIRDKYKAAPKHQYQRFIEELPGSFLLLAYAAESQKPIAGLLGVLWNGMGIYYYGASDHTHRALMAPYLLQWEAMQFCKQNGCTAYDLLGVAPPNADEDHPWQGISSFKEKFGGTLITYPQEKRIPLKRVMNAMLNTKRKVFG